jgi:cytidylate kinase
MTSMKHHAPIERYFRNASIAAAERPRPPAPFVTISREAGAGGHELAQALVARLSRETDELSSGWHVFDKELCELVVQDPGLRVSLAELLEEEFHTGLDDMMRSLFAGVSPQIKINHHLFRVVRSVCAVGKAIVIGRAGALLTRDLPQGVHVRVVSRRAARVERVKRAGGLDAAAARKFVGQMDERRARLINAVFNRDIGDPLLYDCVWNADAASFDEMAESLVPLIRARASRGLRPAIA